MDSLISTLSTFPPDKSLSHSEYEKAAKAYLKALADIPQSTWTQSLSKTDIFDAVDPAVHSVGYLIALQRYITAAGAENRERVLRYAIAFFEQFDAAQIRLVTAEWTDLYHWTANVLLDGERKDIAFMGDALLRLDTTPVFTICHVCFLRLCLRSSTPSIACLVLDKDIHHYPDGNNKNTAADSASVASNDRSLTSRNDRLATPARLTSDAVLEYYLLGAQVYIGVSNWRRARLFLEFVILHPSIHHATSSFQVEAYKKWVLIGLLNDGSPFATLRTIDQAALKSLRAIARPYDTLAETFRSRNWRKLQAEVDIGAQIWLDDGNARLVQAVADAILAYCVSDLQKTYVALPISTVSEHLGLPANQTHDLLRQMIDQGRLKAHFTTGAFDALHFDSGAPDATLQQPYHIEAQTKRIEALVHAVQDADRRSRLTKEHLDVMRRNKRQNVEDDPADQMDLEWTSTHVPTRVLADDGDEDIMA